MAKNKRSNDRKVCSCSMVLFKSYKQLHLTFATSCVTCLKIISWITLDYPNAVKSGHCLTKDCQEKRKSCEVRRSGLKHNARCGLVAGMKVIGPVFLPREPYTVHYTVKRKVCAGLKPIWLVQVWRQRDLESIVLDLRVRAYPSISAFTRSEGLKPTDVVFKYRVFGPLCLIHTDWSIILHCAVIAMRTEMIFRK